MALVSPGVETKLSDESLFVSNSASIVPLFFIATQDEKIRANGEPAAGTYEHSVVRSINSLRQSINFYGEPSFLEDSAGNKYHGDARNEYGLLALNQFLAIGSGAFTVRANVNLNDNLQDTQIQWDRKTLEANIVIKNLVQNYINNVNSANGLTQAGFSVLKSTSRGIPYGQGQTQSEFDGTAPFGSGIFDTSAVGVATNYAIGDVITMENGMVVRVTGVDLHAGQTGLGEPTTFVVVNPGNTSFLDGLGNTVEVNIGSTLGTGQTHVLPAPPNAGEAPISVTDINGTIVTDRSGFELTLGLANLVTYMQSTSDFVFAGGTGYTRGEKITLSNGAMVEVVKTDSGNSDVVTQFALKTPGSFVSDTQVLTQISTSGGTPGNPGSGFTLTIAEANLQTLKETVSATELQAIIEDATLFIFDENVGTYTFRNLGDDFFVDKTSNPVTVFPFGFDQPSSGEFIGLEGEIAAGTNAGGSVAGEWTPEEAAQLFVDEATKFKFTQLFLVKTSLGSNDAARRVSIVAALQSAIVSNTDVRSESFQFNVVACPGYPEVVDELLALSADQKNEIFVVGDTPPNLTPEQVTNPTNGWAITSERQNSTDVAYYYPWCLTTNLDGSNVLGAPSGTAIRQLAFNDQVSFLWYAPAGTTRGLVTGVSAVGYATGILGGPTEFTSVSLNEGQRDALYQDVPSGRINPIVRQPGIGIALMGQKTSSPKTSASDRINVVRLTMHVRRRLRLSTANFLFEPNDQQTRDNVKGLADNFLTSILANRGIVEFLTVCDASNNTADVVDRSELILDVLIKPTKAVEFITIPIRLVSQGASV